MQLVLLIKLKQLFILRKSRIALFVTGQGIWFIRVICDRNQSKIDKSLKDHFPQFPAMDLDWPKSSIMQVWMRIIEYN